METHFSSIAYGIDVGYENFCMVRVRVTGTETKKKKKTVRTLSSYELLDYSLVDIRAQPGIGMHVLLFNAIDSFVTQKAPVYVEQQKSFLRHIAFAAMCICSAKHHVIVRSISSRSKYNIIYGTFSSNKTYRQRKDDAVMFLNSFTDVNHEKKDDIADAVLVAIEGIRTE